MLARQPVSEGEAPVMDAAGVVLPALCGCLLLLLLLLCLRRPTNFPPGPQWLPFVGNLIQLRRLIRLLGHQHLALQRLSEQYHSPVVGLRLGGDQVVVVFSQKLVHQVLTQDEFSGRPDTFFIRLRSMGTKKGITFTDGPLWQEQRHFVSRQLRQLGLGKQPMEQAISAELEELTARLQGSAGAAGVRPARCLATGVLNVLWALVAGVRFPHADPQLHHLLRLMEKRARCFDMAGGTLSQMPWLRHVLPNRTGYNVLLQLNAQFSHILRSLIDSHRSTYNPEETRDLIDAFLHEMGKKSNDSSTFTDEQLMMVCLDLFIAGSQTTSTTINFALLMMLLHPDVQSKVHAEIDCVLGEDQLPNLKHQDRMPYTSAVLLEVQRMYAVTPVIGPRRVLKDTSLHNFNISQGTTVLISVWSVHMDKAHWGDPDVFRPERFIDSCGKVNSDNWVLTFGLGKRRCLGEALAKSCIFMFFTGILQKFQILPVPGEELPSDKPVPGLILAPQPYTVQLRPRDSTSNCF